MSIFKISQQLPIDGTLDIFWRRRQSEIRVDMCRCGRRIYRCTCANNRHCFLGADSLQKHSKPAKNVG